MFSIIVNHNDCKEILSEETQLSCVIIINSFILNALTLVYVFDHAKILLFEILCNNNLELKAAFNK